MTNKADAQQAAKNSDEPRVHNRYHNTAPPDAVYIGRGTMWSNPFHISDTMTRDDVCEKFEAYAQATPGFRAMTRNLLKGRHLVCSCAPARCHGDWLLKTANSEEAPDELEKELELFKQVKHAIERRLNMALGSHNDLDNQYHTGLNADRYVFNLHANVKLLTDEHPLGVVDEEALINILERVLENALGIIRLFATQTDDSYDVTGLGALVATSVAIVEDSLESLIHENIVADELEDAWLQDLLKSMKYDLLSVLQKLLFSAEGSQMFFGMPGVFYSNELFSMPVQISRSAHHTTTPGKRINVTRSVSLRLQTLPHLAFNAVSLSMDLIGRAIEEHELETLEMIRKGVTSREALLAMKLDGDPPF